MKKFKFKPMTVDDICQMAQLLLRRQNLEGQFFRFLKNSFINESSFIEILRELFENNTIAGLGAFDGEELAGFILGRIKIDMERGRHVWVPYEGTALGEGQSYELLRELYAKASVKWLEHGCFTHYIMAPLGDNRYFDALLRLSFSIEQVHGVHDMDDYRDFEETSNAIIRLGDKGDREVMGQLSSTILSFQNASPAYVPALPEVVKKIRAGYLGIVEDDEAILILAEKNKNIAGFQCYWPSEPGIMSPDRAAELGIAGTCFSERGSGIGKKLMNQGCRIMKEKGYKYLVTDWRIANPSSSTFWPKCGFKPIAYRMVRTIDENIAWANFENPINKR